MQQSMSHTGRRVTTASASPKGINQYIVAFRHMSTKHVYKLHNAFSSIFRDFNIFFKKGDHKDSKDLENKILFLIQPIYRVV